MLNKKLAYLFILFILACFLPANDDEKSFAKIELLIDQAVNQSNTYEDSLQRYQQFKSELLDFLKNSKNIELVENIKKGDVKFQGLQFQNLENIEAKLKKLASIEGDLIQSSFFLLPEVKDIYQKYILAAYLKDLHLLKGNLEEAKSIYFPQYEALIKNNPNIKDKYFKTLYLMIHLTNCIDLKAINHLENEMEQHFKKLSNNTIIFDLCRHYIKENKINEANALIEKFRNKFNKYDTLKSFLSFEINHLEYLIENNDKEKAITLATEIENKTNTLDTINNYETQLYEFFKLLIKLNEKQKASNIVSLWEREVNKLDNVDIPNWTRIKLSDMYIELKKIDKAKAILNSVLSEELKIKGASFSLSYLSRKTVKLFIKAEMLDEILKFTEEFSQDKDKIYTYKLMLISYKYRSQADKEKEFKDKIIQLDSNFDFNETYYDFYFKQNNLELARLYFKKHLEHLIKNKPKEFQKNITRTIKRSTLIDKDLHIEIVDGVNSLNLKIEDLKDRVFFAIGAYTEIAKMNKKLDNKHYGENKLLSSCLLIDEFYANKYDHLFTLENKNK